MAGTNTEKRIRKQPDRFSVWKEGDKHPPMSIRSQANDKKKKQKEKNDRFQKKKKEKKEKTTKSDKDQKNKNGEK